MRTRPRTHRTPGAVMLLALCGASAAFSAAPPQNERGALVRAISKWDEPEGEWHCDGSERTNWGNMAKAWYDDLTNGNPAPSGHGSAAWWRDGYYHNGYIVDSNFVDEDLQVWGLDHDGDKADEPDALMVAMHGGNGSEGRWSGSVRVNQFGDDGSLNNCGTWQGHMEFGDSDLEFLHLSSCVSMDQPDWYPNWAQSFKGVHQVDGFHGVMYISSEYIDEYRDFADDAYDTGIAIAWVENLYKYREAGKNQCPVALGVGVGAAGQESCWTRLTYERYNNVYTDPTVPTWFGVAWVEGCDPKSGDPLPTNAGGVPDVPPSAAGAAGSGAKLQFAPAEPPRVQGTSGSTGDPDELPPLDRTAMTLAGYVAQVDGEMPSIPSTMLAAGTGPDWLASVSVARIATAVSDTTPEAVVSDGPRTEGRDTADTKVFKIDTERGRVRYINRERHFDWATDPHGAWSASLSQAMAETAIDLLGVPATERTPARVDTLGGQDYQAGSTSSVPFSTLEMERWVTFERAVNGFPVQESFVRAAVSNHGQIARLHVRWPQFRLRPGLVLRPRQDVVSEIAARIQQAEFGAAVNLDIHLAYAPAGTDYIPVAVATFDDPYSAEIVYVPLVEVPADRDFDGIGDAADNCLETKNAGQQDRDGDGAGDACDNCPDTPNPGQEDGDATSGTPDPTGANPPNGVGDACEQVEDVCQLPDGTCEVFTHAQCAAEGAVFADEAASPLLFSDPSRMLWSPVPGGTYNVYRGTHDGGRWAFDHTCFDPDLASSATTDPDEPPPSTGFYYLISVETGCGESGLGASSSGVPRPNDAPCP